MTDEKENILEEVENKSQKEIKSILNRAKKVADKEVSMAEDKAREIVEEKKERYRAEFEKEKKKKTTQINLEYKQKKLSYQHELVQKLFEQTLKEVSQLERNEDYFNILSALILKAVKAIGEDEIIVYLNKKDLSFTNKNNKIEKIKGFIRKEYKEETTIEFAQDSIDVSGGAIVCSKAGRIRFYNTFEDILDRKKDELEADILGELFKGEMKG